MLDLTNFLSEYLSYDRIIFLYYIFNVAVQTLPDPDENSSVVYVSVFKFIHLLAGNINVTRKKV